MPYFLNHTLTTKADILFHQKFGQSPSIRTSSQMRNCEVRMNTLGFTNAAPLPLSGLCTAVGVYARGQKACFRRRAGDTLPVLRPVSRPHVSKVTAGLFDMWKVKPEDPNAPPKYGFDIGFAYLAHPEKDTGEDAFFIEGRSIGVFDGVSGTYETRGVDPRLYSQRLASRTCELVKKLGPKDVTKAAIRASNDNDEIGASTVCVVGMDRTGRLFGINLGDSGVRLIRGEKLVFRTKEQQHFFNCPYQLGTDSEDGIAMGQNIQQNVQEGDVLIVATDGLFDNVPNYEIIQYVQQIQDPMTLAESLGELASERGMDEEYESPFMKAAKAAGEKWKGGKPDDITVVVARVVDGAAVANQSVLSTIPEAEAV